MKRTVVSAKSFTIALLQGVLIFLLGLGVLAPTILSYLVIGPMWGTYLLLFFSFVAVYFYVHHMKGVKEKVSDHMDAFIATLASYAGTLFVIAVGIVLGAIINKYTHDATIGWASFGAFVLCILLCYFSAHKRMVEDEY